MAFDSRAPRTQMMSEAPPRPGSGTRPSTPPPAVTPVLPMTAETPLRFAAQTDVGKQRNHNEDNYLVDRKLRLYVVCDGMGGHAAGEVASALAVRTLHDEIKKEADLLKDYAEGASGGAKVTKRDILKMLEFEVNSA